ncbi:MAG: hypothetical protein QOH31_7188, partial [Verrucomicrobiota bacterium]
LLETDYRQGVKDVSRLSPQHKMVAAGTHSNRVKEENESGAHS